MPLPPLSAMDGEILDGTWYVHLRHARCEEDIVASVREFLDALTPSEVARLPIRCLEVSTSGDIPRLSSFLARNYEMLPAQSTDRPIYMRTIALLCYATDRLSQVPAVAPQAWETFL
jgi:hypothetical protein